MGDKTAKAAVTPVRQRTQYSCMSTSMMMCLQANGVDCDEKEVNKVMGARPMKGATWESALACAQHYGMRATLTTPATVKQLKAWTDQGIPVMIAWNPEGRDWSHASTVFNVTDGLPEIDSTMQVIGSGPGLYIWVADPNLPNPEKTVRIVHEDDFYGKWYEKWPDYLVRRPACAIEQEITSDGRQVMASVRTASTIVGGRSPNQTGSSAMLKRQGLTPVDTMFGEALPHRRSIIMQGEQVQDKRGAVWFFVGTDAKGKAILAETEREMKGLMDRLVEDRLHHNVAAAKKRKKKPLSEKDKLKIPTDTGKRRDPYAQAAKERKTTPGHKRKERGRSVDKGHSRKPKHKQDLRQQQRAGGVTFDKSLFDKPQDTGPWAVYSEMNDATLNKYIERYFESAPMERVMDGEYSGTARQLWEMYRNNWRKMRPKDQETHFKAHFPRQHRKHRYAASVERVTSAFLSPKRADAASGRLDRGLKSKINSALRKGGLDGNGRFRKSSEAYSKAVDILDDWGLELDTVVSSHLFNGPSGSMQVDVAFTNESDRFSPVSITNSVLYLQFTELRDGVFEAVAYMS